MTQTNKCQHDGETITGWDEVTCRKCGWIVPSGQLMGIHDGWFPSHEAHKEFKKYRTYTGMDNTYPIDATKHDEVQNITQTNNEREALHKIMEQVQVYASSYSLVGTRFASDYQLEEADREKLALYNMVKYALRQSPISQNEQQEHCCPECGCHFVGEFPFEYHTKQAIPDGALNKALACEYQSNLDSEQIKHFNAGVAALYDAINTAPTNTEVGE